MTDAAGNLSLAVLISGDGSNLQALIDAINHGLLAAMIAVVISNDETAGGLQRARDAAIPVAVLGHGEYADRESYDDAIRDILDRYQPDLLLLAGFMRILSEKFVQHYAGRILNIHPSLLPKYTGLNTHERALAAGEATHGCTVHFVTPALDAGPQIIQGSVDVLDNDTPETLAGRVLEIEHKIYPRAVGMIASGRLQYRDDRSWLDGKPLDEPVVYHGGDVRL